MARKTQEIINELYPQLPKGDTSQLPFKVEFSHPYKRKVLKDILHSLHLRIIHYECVSQKTIIYCKIVSWPK